jgi:hypothetical protein
MESQNGNLWTDPIFCDGPGGDYSLSGFSSCLPGSHPQGHACGLIGAFAQGCHAGQPAILSVLDVPDDQGGTIQLTWAASPLDLVPGWPSVTSYDLAREIPATLDWEILETRVAAGREFYEAFLPTLADSSDTWTETHRVLSTYKVVARTDDPSLFISSFPDSGYSVDNLAPDTPTDFAVTYREGSGYWLNWRQIPTPDLREFRVFRRMGGSAVPFSLMASTDQVQWHDNEATPGMAYQVAAVDQVGNQSPVSGVQSINFPPRASLLGVYPNPASSVATIVFELPRKAAVSLVVFDLKGLLVKRLVEDEEWTIGRHEFTWPGVDTEGRPVPSGRYFCRFQAEGVQETRGITLVH